MARPRKGGEAHGTAFAHSTRERAMSMEELEIEAMMLPLEERERLAERLLWSLGSDLAFERERTSCSQPDPDDDSGDALWETVPPPR